MIMSPLLLTPAEESGREWCLPLRDSLGREEACSMNGAEVQRETWVKDGRLKAGV